MENTEIILDTEIKHHLFILSNDVCGTNLLHTSFQKCENVSNLPKDAELLFLTDYFPPPVFENANFFMKERELIEGGNDMGWNNNAMQLEWHWQQSNPKAKYRLGKSLYDFLRPHILIDYFTNIGFLIMVKNPYAVVTEMIQMDPTLESEIENLAEYVMHSLIIQRKNNYLLGNNLAFTYEDMIKNPSNIENQIKEKYELEDFKLNLDSTPSSEELINKLTDFQIETINESLKKSIDTLRYWGYELVERE